MTRSWTPERRAALILIAIAFIEGAVVVAYFVVNGARFMGFMGFSAARAGNALGLAY